MTSSSIILSNILASESCELKTTIDSYMDTKLKEFQEIMKSKVDSIITEKIDKFYNKSFDDHEKVLFDRNGSHLIDGYNMSCLHHKAHYTGDTIAVEVQFKKSYPLYPVSKENTQCFIKEYRSGNYGNDIKEIAYFKNFVIEGNSNSPPQGCNREWRYEIHKHNLSSDILFSVKFIENIRSMKFVEEHPEYFKKNCSDFEQICRKEYSEIEKTKLQLKALMDEQITKKDYYASLEKKFKDIEIEKKQLEEDRIKLKEEKEKMVFIKEKLMQMKEEVELEKQKIEQQKNKTVDLDKCFEEIISSEKSKNKQSAKVAFD
jgi:hypothetical protein